MSRRKAISASRADSIVFESDRTCCICEDRGRDRSIQIHHIDGNPANNAVENLAVLCLEHHNEASTPAGNARALTAGVVRKYSRSWNRKVRERRRRRSYQPRRGASGEARHDEILEALACHEIVRLNYRLSRAEITDEKQLVELFDDLFVFADYRYGFRVRSELLSGMSSLAGSARFGIAPEIAHRIESLTTNSFRIFSLVGKDSNPLHSEELQLLTRGASIGFSLAYDGIKYLSNIHIVEAGTRILWVVLRYARLNGHTDVEERALKEFSRLKEVAVERKFALAWQQIEFDRLDSLAIDSNDLPDFPAPPSALR